MPRFDFHCKKCANVFEEQIEFGSKRYPACPKCKSKNVDKLISLPGIQFKGEGFYKTDSRAPAKQDAPKKETPAKPDSSSAA